MRKLTHYLTPGLMAAALLFAPALMKEAAAQDPAATPTTAATPAPAQEDPACADLYKQFTDKWTIPGGKGQAEAYPIGKQYMEKCGQNENERTAYVKKKVTSFEDATLVFNFNTAIRKGTADAAPDVYKYGKQLLAKKPDDLDVILGLARYGYLAFTAKDLTYKSDAISYGKQAIQMLEAGGTLSKDDILFPDKNSALSWMNFQLGTILYNEKNWSDAMGYLYKTSQLPETDPKNGIPKAYYLFYLAEAYNAGDVTPASEAFKKFSGQPVSPESQAAEAHLNQVMDRAMDLYARVVNLASDAATKSFHDQALEQLTIYYKYRHDDKDAGLTDFIASVNKTPIPDPKSALPPPPPPTPPATATGAGVTTPSTTTGPKPPLGAGAPTPGKPGMSTSPAKPVGTKPPAKAAPQNSRSAH